MSGRSIASDVVFADRTDQVRKSALRLGAGWACCPAFGNHILVPKKLYCIPALHESRMSLQGTTGTMPPCLPVIDRQALNARHGMYCTVLYCSYACRACVHRNLVVCS